MTDQQDDLVSQLEELAAVIPDGATNRADAKTVTAALAEIERLTLERNDALDDYLRRHKDVIDMLRRATRAEDELARLRAHIETSDHAHACAVQEMSGEMERLRAQVIDGCELATKIGLEVERLRAALKDMLFWFGKPALDEWMNRPAWEEAKQVCANAERALAGPEQRPGD